MEEKIFMEEFASKEAGIEFVEGLNLEAYYHYKLDDNAILFGSRVPTELGQLLSCTTPCEFTIGSVTFHSMEQAYYYMHTNFPEHRSKFMACEKPFEATEYGRHLDAMWFDEACHNHYIGWIELGDLENMAILTNRIYWRCKNDENFRNALLNTGDANLIETDDWGGKDFCCYKYIDNGEEWAIGGNSTGKALMFVRDSWE